VQTLFTIEFFFSFFFAKETFQMFLTTSDNCKCRCWILNRLSRPLQQLKFPSTSKVNKKVLTRKSNPKTFFSSFSFCQSDARLFTLPAAKLQPKYVYWVTSQNNFPFPQFHLLLYLHLLHFLPISFFLCLLRRGLLHASLVVSHMVGFGCC